MAKTPKIFTELSYIATVIPIPVYWLDTNCIIVGGNDLCLSAIGSHSKTINEVLIGKTFYDYYPNEIAYELTKMIKIVLETKKSIIAEEKIVDIITGKFRYYDTVRAPLFDCDGSIVGTICTAIEVTAKKEAEETKLARAKHIFEKNKFEFEKKIHEVEKHQQTQIRRIVEQVVHDIRSPIATLQMILPHCDNISEKIRLTVTKSVTRIQDIASNLLNQFKLQHDGYLGKFDSKQSISLINSDILDVITEKRYEYMNSPVNFITKISQAGHFAFIDVNILEFKCMLSNIINNAVDALDNYYGRVNIHLDVIDNKVQIIIEDNGKGMTYLIKQKILNSISVTSGKKNGHGIGYEQIRNAITNNGGELNIESKINIGTQIIVTFPIAITPGWMCSLIELEADNLVVILDDDPSIHGAWDARFKKEVPNIILKHFEQGIEAIEYITNLPTFQKEKVFLLTDYELLKQNTNGLDVINQTKCSRSILVTSHHNNETVRNIAKASNTKILPKLLASEVGIIIARQVPTKTKIVDLVIIDDDELLVSTIIKYILVDKLVDTYNTAHEFLLNVHNYSKDTNFIIDNEFKGECITGIEISKKLYALGFRKLYLFSGGDYTHDNSIPSYLNIIAKTDVEVIKNLK